MVYMHVDNGKSVDCVHPILSGMCLIIDLTCPREDSIEPCKHANLAWAVSTERQIQRRKSKKQSV